MFQKLRQLSKRYSDIYNNIYYLKFAFNLLIKLFRMPQSESLLVCCLCNYKSASESDLEIHIDRSHADIFRFSSGASKEMAINYNQVKMGFCKYCKSIRLNRLKNMSLIELCEIHFWHRFIPKPLTIYVKKVYLCPFL